MTMCIAIVQGGAAHLYADTAHVSASDGRVQRFDHKLIAGSRFPWVIAHNMFRRPNSIKSPLDSEPRNIDELIKKLIPAAKAFAQGSIDQDSHETIRLVVAAWDERRKRPRIFVAADDSETIVHSPHCPPGVGEVRYFVGVDEDVYSEVAEIWRGGSPNDPAYFHPVFDAAQAFEVQRAKGCGLLGRQPPGGALEMATLTRNGVVASVIYRWPDRVGAAIRSGPLNPAPAGAARVVEAL